MIRKKEKKSMDCCFCAAKNLEKRCTIFLPHKSEFWIGIGEVGMSCPDCLPKGVEAVKTRYKREITIQGESHESL